MTRYLINKNLFGRTVALTHAGPPLILAGLAALILVTAFPEVPAITALSILTLGATNATLDRFRNAPAITTALLLHAATYIAVYTLFIGATLYAAATGALGTLVALDLALSILPMAIAAQRVAIALRPQSEPQR